eukprot:scaffold4059_cov177-Amphora_coffeaeformis.AAC.2
MSKSGSSQHSSRTPKRSSADRNVEQQLIDMIGKGPVRKFGPVCQAPDLQKRITRLQVEHLDAYVKIKTAYEEHIASRKKTVQPLLDDLILRAAVVHNFDEVKAVELLRRMETRFWTLTAKQLEADLKLEICVPLPHIKTKTCQDVLYFMPARFAAKERSSSVVISLMTYVMNAMYERYRDRRRKTCIIINLRDWTFDQHFRLDAWLQLMDLWQGRTAPLRISQVLMVNATADFEKAWTTIKTMGSSSFCGRVQFLEDESSLSEHMSSPEYIEHLPNDFGTGSVPMKSLVREFMVYRVTLERLLKLNEAVQHPSGKFAPPANPPKTPRTPAPLPETPRTATRKSQNLFQSNVLNAPTLPTLESPSKPRRLVVSTSPDTPAPTRRSFMSRTSSVPTLRAPSAKLESSPIVEIDSDESESERDLTPSSQEQPVQFQPAADAAVTAVQFQPAIKAAVAAESGNSDKEDEESDHEEHVTKNSAPFLPSRRPKRGIFHRTASVPRLMGGGGLGKSSRSSKRGLQTTRSSRSIEAAPEQPRTEGNKTEESKAGALEPEKKGGRGSLLKNMGRKALNRFQSRRTLISRTQSVAVLSKETDDSSPTSSRTSGLDFEYDNGDADTHLNSKQGRGFQMLG